MIKINSSTEAAVRNMLQNTLIQEFGVNDEITVKKISGVEGYYRNNVPNSPVQTEYFSVLANNPAAVLHDLRQRFPDLFMEYGFGKNMPNVVKTAPISSGAVGSSGSENRWVLIVILILAIIGFRYA